MAAVLIAGMLAGCGKAKPDPNSGVYEAVSAKVMGMDMDVSEIYENGVTFDLQDGGKCVADLDGESYKIKWSTDGNSVHIEGRGVELDGTIGGGDMTIENMMDMGIDMTFHCDKLLHEDIGDEDTKDSDKDKKDDADKENEGSSASSGSVLKRLKDAKNGKDVYSGAVDRDAEFWGNPDFEFEEGSDETEVIEYGDDADFSGLMTDDNAIDGDIFVNPEYESETGKEFSVENVGVSVPADWKAFEVSDNSIRVIKGGSSIDDYMSKTSILIEWHPGAKGSLDTSRMEDPVNISKLKLGDHNYNGASGTVPGDWTSYMFIDEYEDGYLYVDLSLPTDSDVYLMDADVQFIMASADVYE